MSSSSSSIREREQDEENPDSTRYAKRTKLDEPQSLDNTVGDAMEETAETASTPEHSHILPPSHALLGIPLPVMQKDAAMTFMETDVGISEYIGRGVPKIEGIIKQRQVQCSCIMH